MYRGRKKRRDRRKRREAIRRDVQPKDYPTQNEIKGEMVKAFEEDDRTLKELKEEKEEKEKDLNKKNIKSKAQREISEEFKEDLNSLTDELEKIDDEDVRRDLNHSIVKIKRKYDKRRFRFRPEMSDELRELNYKIKGGEIKKENKKEEQE